MEITVSLPEKVFEAAERLARARDLTLSTLLTEALEGFLKNNQTDPLTEAINRVADRADTRLELGLKQLQNATLERRIKEERGKA